MDFNINLKLGVNKMKYTVTENLLIELYENRKQQEELDTRLKQQFKKNSYGDYIYLKNNDIRIEVNEDTNNGTWFELYDDSIGQEELEESGYLDSYRDLTTAMEAGLNHIENF